MAHGFDSLAANSDGQEIWKSSQGIADKVLLSSAEIWSNGGTSASGRFTGTLFNGTMQGVENRLQEMGEHKAETAAEFTIATSIGIGLGLMNKMGGKYATVAKWGGRAMLTVMGVDLTRRVGSSLYLAGDSAFNAQNYQSNTDAVANNMGVVAVDYPLMALGGYGTAKVMSGGKFSMRELLGLKGKGTATAADVVGESAVGELAISTGADLHAGERLTTQAMRKRLTLAEQGQDKKGVSGFGDLFKVMAERTNLKENPALSNERVQLLNDLKAVDAAQTELAGLNNTKQGLVRQRSALDGAVQSAEQHLAQLEQVKAELPGKRAEMDAARAEVAAARKAARAKETGQGQAEGEPPAAASGKSNETGARGESDQAPLTVEELQAKFELAKQEVEGLQSRLDSRPQLEQAVELAKTNREANAGGIDAQISALNETIAAKQTQVDALQSGVEARFHSWTAQADGLVQAQTAAVESGGSGVRFEELPPGSEVTAKAPPKGNTASGAKSKTTGGPFELGAGTGKSTGDPLVIEPVQTLVTEPVARVVEPVAKVVEPVAKVVEPVAKVTEPTVKQPGDRAEVQRSAPEKAGGEIPVTAKDVSESVATAEKALKERRYVVGMRETAKAIAQHLELFRTDPGVDNKAFLARVQGLLSKIDVWEAPTRWLRSEPGRNEIATIMQRTGIDADVMAANRNWARNTQTLDNLGGRPIQGFQTRPNEMPELTLSRLQQHLEARVRVENGKNFLNKLPDADRLDPAIVKGLEIMRSGRLPDGTPIPDDASLIALGQRNIGGKDVVMALGNNRPNYIDKAAYDRWFEESQIVRQKGLGALSEEQQLGLRHHHGPERFTGTKPDGFAILFPGKGGKVIKFVDLPQELQGMLSPGFARGSNTLRLHSDFQRLMSLANRGG